MRGLKRRCHSGWAVRILAANSRVFPDCRRQGVRTLTPEPGADPSQARTKAELGAALKSLITHKQLTFADIVRRTRTWADPVRRATLSDAVQGKTVISYQVLASVLDVCEEPEQLRRRWFEARDRVKASSSETDTARPVDRFDAASPSDLGIHSAIEAPGTTDDLPAYVERDFDFRLRTALAVEGSSRGRFVILIGGSSTGKTRSLYEAVHEVAANWWLVQPTEAEELLALRDDPPTRTVFWLDELQRYLGSNPPLSLECVRALTRNKNLVVGTLWPDQYDAALRPRQPHLDEADDIRRLLGSAFVISVADDLNPDELERARSKAAEDSRIRIALETRDAGLTQALAGGPALVLSWEQAPNQYARAMITAAADAHRLGVQSPLSEELLSEAMFGYLRPDLRVTPHDVWLDQARPHATRPLHGDVRALSPVDNGRPGELAGYTVADYLAQHLRRLRRVKSVPAVAWQALVTKIDRSADLRRLADSATARLRYVYAELALERLVDEFSDAGAVLELAQLLIRQDRFEQAFHVLQRRLGVAPHDQAIRRQLARTMELWERVDDLRAENPERVIEILTDGGISDDLRIGADAGDAVAAEDLVERLAERGCLRELEQRADRGHVYAAEALADLYVARGSFDLLEARAKAGDQAAELRLSKVHEAGVRSASAGSEVAGLRAAAGGDPDAARQLCTLLFELRDLDGLRAELEAGTYGAADRLIALYTADEIMPPQQLAHLRAFGLAADGTPITPGRTSDGRLDPH
jgi:hypothetical protein